MHRASTRYSKRSSSTKARQGPGQHPDGLQLGEGGDLRRKILQRTHSIASRSPSNSHAATTSPNNISKPRSPGLESYYMPAILSPPRRSSSSMPSSPSQGYFPSPGPLSPSTLENHHRYSFYSTPKQVSSSQVPGSKDREDVDITDYYSESIRMRGLYATQFADLPNPPSTTPSSPTTRKREGADSVKDLDFGLQMLLARQLFGTNGVPGVQRVQDRNALGSTLGSPLGLSHVLPPDGDIAEALPIDSDSDRQRGVSFNMNVGEEDAEANGYASINGFDMSSGFSATKAQRRSVDAVKLSGNVAEERIPPPDDGDITNSHRTTFDSSFEADICDVELTSLSPRVGCEHTFMNFTPPHVFDAFPPMRPPPCRIRTVSQLPTSVF